MGSNKTKKNFSYHFNGFGIVFKSPFNKTHNSNNFIANFHKVPGYS